MIFKVFLFLAVLYLLWKAYDMSEAIDRLTSDVTDLTDAVDSAVAIIEGLAAQIRENIDDKAALGALADALEADKDKLAAAVTANTPADPNPAPEPSPEPQPDLPTEPTTDEPTA